jgi:hypothetical protein
LQLGFVHGIEKVGAAPDEAKEAILATHNVQRRGDLLGVEPLGAVIQDAALVPTIVALTERRGDAASDRTCKKVPTQVWDGVSYSVVTPANSKWVTPRASSTL